MLLNVGRIVQSAATLLDDPSQSWADQAYLLPFINLAWDDLSVSLAALGLNYQEEVVEIQVTAGTSDLSAFQVDGQPLDSMMLPVKVEWKLPTDPDTQYKQVFPTENLPDVNSDVQGHSAYEWRKSKIFLTPSSVDTVVRVRFKAFSVDFTDPIDGIVVGAGNILVYKTCELINSPTVRNNAAGAKYCALKGADAQDNFEVLCVKQKQRNGNRIGRQSGRSHRQPRYVARVGS